VNGSALAVNWINEHANAVLEAWYPGEEGGAAVAETLSGKNNPAGKLPVTFYTGVSQLPNFEDYGMAIGLTGTSPAGRSIRSAMDSAIQPSSSATSAFRFSLSLQGSLSAPM